ncbi:hypothetical protein P8452_26187 [Trifolium repens]|nr:hypothetical protein P8452_26187 [Trifolium repens]
MPSQDQAHGSEVEHDVGDEANVAEAEANVAEDEENVAEDEDGGDDDGQAPVVPEEGYGGGPSDLSLLHEYHKHRANQIWECTNSEAPILKKVMRSVANGKKAYMAKSCKKLGKRIGLMAGYMSLLQGWVISHMPRMSVWKLATNWKETLPYNAKFENMLVLNFDVAIAAFV